MLLVPLAVEATVTTVYSTANRDGYFNWFDDLMLCVDFNVDQDIAGAVAYAGISWLSAVEYDFQRAAFSWNLSTLTAPIDSVWVFIKVASVAKACTGTGTTRLNVYTGDCALGTSCTSAIKDISADSTSCTTLRRTYTVGSFTAGNWLSFKMDKDSITVGSGHTLDVAIRMATQEQASVCGCGATTTKRDRLTFVTVEGVDPANRPYILVYTTSGGRKRVTGEVGTDGDVWFLRKKIIRKEGES